MATVKTIRSPLPGCWICDFFKFPFTKIITQISDYMLSTITQPAIGVERWLSLCYTLRQTGICGGKICLE